MTLSRPNRQVFQEFQKSPELFDKEAPNSDAPQRRGGKEGLRVSSSSSSLFHVQDTNKEKYRH